MAATACNHRREEAVTKTHRRQQVQLHQFFPALSRDMVQPPGHGDAGIVDQDIRRYTARCGQLENGFTTFLGGKVRDDRGSEVTAGSVDCRA